MSTKLFKNTEGKVLMSVGNKLIKQPYEFGLAFQNRMGLNNYIEISGLSIGVGWSIIGICDTDGLPTNIDGKSGFIQTAPSTLNIADNIIIQGPRLVANLIDNIAHIVTPPDTDIYKKAFYIQYTNNSAFNSMNNFFYASNTIDTRTRTQMRIGASGYYGGNDIGINTYIDPRVKINLVIIFNRILNIQEYRYFRNNLLFNNLQSYDGVMHYFNLDVAEVINISGTDYPCIRDSIGGKHGKIMNLPAGTAQQKVDYANENLFVPFQ